MIKQKQELKRTELKYLAKEGKFNSKKNFISGTIIAIIIAITPILFNLYNSVPDVKVWNTFLFTYDSNYYESTFVLAWTLISKLIPLLLMFLWIFTCRHWWYHAIIVPIGMFIYQIIIIINDDLSFVDQDEFIYLLPIMAIVIPSIYLVRARLFNRLNTVDKSTQELEDELTFKPKTVWGKIRQFF